VGKKEPVMVRGFTASRREIGGNGAARRALNIFKDPPPQKGKDC